MERADARPWQAILGAKRNARQGHYRMARHEFEMAGLHDHRHNESRFHHCKVSADAEARAAAEGDIALRLGGEPRWIETLCVGPKLFIAMKSVCICFALSEYFPSKSSTVSL